jgi:hypothetical protein
MHSKDLDGDTASPIAGEGRMGRPRLSRRQAIGRIGAVATAGAAAWVVPEILTATPASGASLSASVGNSGTGASVGVSTSAGTTGTGIPSTGASVTGTGGVSADPGTLASDAPNTLAFTGLDIQRDAAVGAALVAGGWAMHHWASRTPRPAVAADGSARAAGSRGKHGAGSAGPDN